MLLWLVQVDFVEVMSRRLLISRMMNVAAINGVLVLGLLASVGVASGVASDAEHSPIDLLGQMSKALSELEYEGTLVYLNGHELSTLRLAHRIDGGQAFESLLALSGPVRAVARSHQSVTCVLPDARAISLPRHGSSASTLHAGALDAERLQPHYLVRGLGRSRVAGRDTLVVGIIPRDDLRYGYRFYIDEETGLPLKTDLMDDTATPIEQVMFTEIEFLDRVSDGLEASALAPSSPADASPASAPIDSAPWRFSELPAGYQVVASDPPAADADAIRRWFMISDGLSAVSVYIEPDQGQGLNGHKRVGAVNAAGRSLDGHQITAVGEAPPQTVQAIAAAVKMQP